MRLTMLVRRRAKRWLCMVLGGYAVFLLFSLTSRQPAETEPFLHLSPQRHGGRAALSDHHQDTEGDRGSEPGEDRHELLLPEALDRAIQQQPGAPAARKKLSRLEPQQVNVVVEDAPPDTFPKRLPAAGLDVGFEDLRHEERGQLRRPAADTETQREGVEDKVDTKTQQDEEGKRKSGAKTQQEEGGEEKGGRKKIRVMVRQHPLDRLRAMKRRGGRVVDMDVPVPLVPVELDVVPEKEDSGFQNLDPDQKDEASQEEGEAARAPGVWLPPDGAPQDLTQVNTDGPLRVGYQPPLDRDMGGAQTAATLNISVSNLTANFQELGDVTVYSAFYDDRVEAPLVRMLAVGPSGKRLTGGGLWCVFGAESSEPSQVAFRQTADCQRMRKYCFYMLHCRVPAAVHYRPAQSNNSVVLVAGRKDHHALHHSGERLHLDVIVNPRRPAANDSSQDQSALFAVCVPPLFGRVSVVQLVEFVEVNRLLGALHFTFYTFRASQETVQVLALYQRAGLATVLPWNLPAPNDVWGKGQGLALGDCLYRNMHLFHLLACHDLDQLMVPRHAPTWPGLLTDIHARSEGLHSIAAAYELLPVNFYALDADGRPPSSSVRQADAQRLVTLTHVLRGGVQGANLSKLMVRPERALELDLHGLVAPISDLFVSYTVDPHAASLHHYGHQACSPDTEAASSTVHNCEHLSEDRTVWRYKHVLVDRTKAVLQKLYSPG